MTFGDKSPTTLVASKDGTVIEVDKLKPRSETLATLGGVVAGGGVGAAMGALLAGVSAAAENGLATSNIPPGAGRNAAIFGAIGAVVLGTIAFIKTRIHNKWTDRVMAATLEKDKSSVVPKL